MRVVIADDDPVLRRGLCAQVAVDDFEAVPCPNGRAALEVLLGSDPPSLAVVDWMMPHVTGPELCRIVRDADLEVQPFIVILTVKRETTDIIEGLDAGADDYLTKPFSASELRARLRSGRRIADLQHSLRLLSGKDDATGAVSPPGVLITQACGQCSKLRNGDGNWLEPGDIGGLLKTKGIHEVWCGKCSMKEDAEITPELGLET